MVITSWPLQSTSSPQVVLNACLQVYTLIYGSLNHWSPIRLFSKKSMNFYPFINTIPVLPPFWEASLKSFICFFFWKNLWEPGLSEQNVHAVSSLYNRVPLSWQFARPVSLWKFTTPLTKEESRWEIFFVFEASSESSSSD